MSRRTDKFLQFYERLNPAQREAVDTIEGPVMVVAGPGTGKTQVLTLRIANILRQTDTPPDGILALSFTNSGVHSMRERLVELAGSAGYRVVINTFHGFCNEIIQAFPAEFPRIIGSRNASHVEQIKILETIINNNKFKKLKPYGAPFYYLSAILSAIEKLKKDNLKTADEPELNLIFREYEKALRKDRLYDFADMVTEVIAVFQKRKSFLRQIQEEYLYLLADEHQDANRGQNELLALLANYHANPNLFIVGDEKQAIFQFQGASLDNFNYFKKLYPGAKLITLTHNYRSTQNILDAAHNLIGSGKLTAAGKLEKSENKIEIVACAEPNAEERFIAQEIKRRIEKGKVPADEIAVLYRDNADAAPLALALERAGVPIVIQSETDLLGDLTVRKMILLLETVHHFGVDHYLPKFLHLDFLGLEPIKIYQVRTYQELAKSHKEINKKLSNWRRWSQNENLLTLFSAVLEDSGLLSYVLKQGESEKKLARLQSFFEEIKELAANHPDYRLADFIEHLETLRRHNLGLPQIVLSAQSGVRLLTAHKSKGLEFDEVYLVRATDGHFGNRRRKTSLLRSDLSADGDEGGERRLFYVALTRARKQVTITYAKHSRDGRPQLPSQFLEEIDKRLVEFREPKNLETTAADNLRPGPVVKSSLSEKAYLNKIFLDRGLSVTDLNNYLACPRKYFYQNLLRLPQTPEKYLLYGTAIHQTLRDFFDQYRDNKKMSETKLLTRFKNYLTRQPLSGPDFKSTLEKGEKALSGYLKSGHNWPNRIINEFSVRGVWLDDEIKLNGKIDKLEMAENGETRVVDYKTGQPKTRNHIMGLTRAAGSGDYLRQLIFYKLLLENLDAKYRVTSGLIDFIEPDDKGRYHQEEFSLSEQDASALAEQIRQVYHGILSLEFLNHGCGQKNCDWCQLWAVTH